MFTLLSQLNYAYNSHVLRCTQPRVRKTSTMNGNMLLCSLKTTRSNSHRSRQQVEILSFWKNTGRTTPCMCSARLCRQLFVVRLPGGCWPDSYLLIFCSVILTNAYLFSFLVVLDTNQWYHATYIHPGEISITIGSEYDWINAILSATVCLVNHHYFYV